MPCLKSNRLTTNFACELIGSRWGYNLLNLIMALPVINVLQNGTTMIARLATLLECPEKQPY